MEVNIWGCLWNLDGGPFLLRQRIPDVCVFKGCQLEAWYYSNAGGLLLRRRDDVTLGALLQAFAATAREHGRGDAEEPAAILRRQQIRLDDGSTPLDVPHAVVLTLRQLGELVERVRAGEVEDEVWSLQTVVQPDDGLRVVSMYSCDGTGKEKSEVFARQYHRCYALPPQTLTLPSAEEVAADGCIPVEPAQRDAAQSKTLNAVRFAGRFHGLDFEGLVLEFVFDSEGQAVLHGCWCATAFPPEARKRLRGRPLSGQRPVGSLPKSFPVPFVEEPPPAEPEETAPMLARVATAQGLAGPPATASPDAPPAAAPPPPKMEHGSAEGCSVSLELWRGEQFLGEALLPRQRQGTPAQEHTLELQTQETSWPSRLDGRKRRHRAHAEACSEGADPAPPVRVTLRAEWAQGSEPTAPLLSLALLRVEGLPPAEPNEAGPRAWLWHRRWGSSEFLPLWTSSEAREREALIFDPPRRPEDGPPPLIWDEPVNLSLAPTVAAGAEGRQEAPRSPPGSARTPRSPPGSARELRCGPPKSTPEPTLAYQPCPIELATSFKSKDEHVCGAELFTHWGMSEADGSLRTHILSQQVTQRLSTECRGRETRSSLLTKMAAQLEQFHDLQSEWDEEVATAKADFEHATFELDSRDKETVLIREETSEMVQEHERRLASLCADLYESVDVHRMQQEIDEEERSAAEARTVQKRHMVKHLRDKNEVLAESLARTVRKFDQVSTSYGALQKELARRQASQQPPPPQPHPDLVTARSRANALIAEVAQEERDLVELKTRLNRLREDLQAERSHGAKLEDFVRKVAAAPATRMRTGGGFDMDFAARREAATLIQEMAQG